ncbi:uncharacterized protein LOC133745173 isoform X3 [Rosa rugosa]|nr:uncharacterized protein LOC133745173 isoform X3 [Rosa rugosa]XP_062029164.1 uncharacterized protein LOC133745173 isoform X3 [Rosa rugosa]XP_062029165.1 uncharacterized protein LOC133745173 isoform X3 [Rosa rugosa]XP_062029166.1 uncharacterized protein LOC133745173 isoform X3 [Rosa rugosa]
MSVSITLRKLKDLVAVCWFIALWEDPEGAMTALLRNLDHCISSYSSVIQKSEIEDVEECFKLFSLEEAAKFDEVTLANVNNFKKRSKSQSPNAIHKEYIVLTILVATDGEQKLPTNSGTRDLKKALHKLGAISSNKIMMISSKEASCLS